MKIPTPKQNQLLQQATALHQAGRLAEAAASYKKLLQALPEHVLLLNNLGVIAIQQGDHAQAASLIAKSLQISPDQPRALNNQGIVLHKLQHLAAALDSFDGAIKLNADFAEGWFNRGNVLLDLLRREEALSCFDRAIALNPAYAKAYYNRGLTLQSMQRFDEALADYDRAISLNLRDADVYCRRGVILGLLQRLPEAAASLQQAVALKADYAEAWFNLGNVLNELGAAETALDSFARAIALKPDYAEACVNRGNILKNLGRLEQALLSYRRALELTPDSAEFLTNCGLVLQDLLQLDEALLCFDQAIALNPAYAEASWNKALLKLLRGEYTEGFQLYENRWRIQPFLQQARHYPQPLWTGEQSVAGRKLLLYPEQGLGDFIQFCRYIPLLAERGVTILLEAPRPLLAVIRSLNAEFSLLEAGQAVADFDYHCPLLSLPLAFNSSLQTIPAVIPYLSADKGRQLHWRQQWGEKRLPRVGLVCSGGRIHKNDHHRSIPLQQFAALLALPLEFHSLQQELRAEDQAWLSAAGHISLRQHQLTDFADTAALIAEMDLVISVDTSVAHLAGALGKPVWILLPYAPDFRWLLQRSDSPWYPTARLFRQTRAGEWSTVLDEVVQACQ